MDGVLFNSMPHHAKAWIYAFKSIGIEFNEYEAYMREGMTGSGTINELFNKTYGRNASQDECDKLYKTKSEYFDQLGIASPIEDVDKVLNFAKNAGLDIYIVTGSGQKS
ncbi:MAG: HAD hydrolase-like protein, partial [Paludibacteraceae bacterium]|nr:HAD hydrolase-like protein [Paludibacteraceae bacterium]